MNKLLTLTILLGLVGITNRALASANSMSLVIDLQTKISQQIKAQIQSVDPDALVTTSIVLQRTDANLIGTQMQVVGLFATGGNQKIDDEDIQAINVMVMSSLTPFPAPLKKILENTTASISKKSRLQVLPMDAELVKAMGKARESQNTSYQQVARMSKLAEDFAGSIPSMLYKLLGGLAVMLLVFLFVSDFSRARALTKLGGQIASLKIEGGAGSGGGSVAASFNGGAAGAAAGDARGDAVSGAAVGVSSTVTSRENPFQRMPGESIRALFADCYWCEKDAYAAWLWSQLAADQKIQLLKEWPPAEIYGRYLTAVTPVEGQFHMDVAYLQPANYFQLSNADVLVAVRSQKPQWHRLSAMRRESLVMDLKERLTFLTVEPSAKVGEWPSKASTPRALVTRIDATRLSLADEAMLFDAPETLPVAQRKQFPSLVWLALCEPSVMAEILTSIPAQSLAEVWRGPEAVLAKIRLSLPEKKLVLLDEYVKRTPFNPNSPWLATLSNAALARLDIAGAPEIVQSQPRLKAV